MLIALSLGAFPHPDLPLNALFEAFPFIFPTAGLSVIGLHCFFKFLFDRVGRIADSLILDGATSIDAHSLRNRLLENGVRRQLYEGVRTDVMDNSNGVSGPLPPSTRTI